MVGVIIVIGCMISIGLSSIMYKNNIKYIVEVERKRDSNITHHRYLFPIPARTLRWIPIIGILMMPGPGLDQAGPGDSSDYDIIAFNAYEY